MKNFLTFILKDANDTDCFKSVGSKFHNFGARYWRLVLYNLVFAIGITYLWLVLKLKLCTSQTWWNFPIKVLGSKLLWYLYMKIAVWVLFIPDNVKAFAVLKTCSVAVLFGSLSALMLFFELCTTQKGYLGSNFPIQYYSSWNEGI
jgi:hypothetical protein